MDFIKNMEEQKTKVREKIRETLMDFHKNTGAYVASIEIMNRYTFNKFDTTYVNIDVKG